MDKLIVIATKHELDLVSKLKYDGYPVIITGVGIINVLNTLKNVNKNTEIINIGYCGSNKLNIGDIVQISKVHTLSETANIVENEIKLKTNKKYNSVECYTSTDFVTSSNIDKPCVFDMELAAIASLFRNTRSIKVVSDNLSIEEYEENINDRESKSKTSR